MESGISNEENKLISIAKITLIFRFITNNQILGIV
jgi:hypothetical protein